MPYRQVFHDNSEFNNKIIDKPLFHDGDGFRSVGSFFSAAGNMAGRAASGVGRFAQSTANFIGKNKDAIEGVANLAGGVKTIYDTVNSTQKANEELRQMKIKFDNEANMYQKMFDYQNQLKKVENEKKKLIV